MSGSQLCATTSQLDVILRGITDGLTIQDASGRLTYANDAAARLLGFTSVAELLAMPVQDLMGRYETLDAQGGPLAYQDLPSVLARRGIEAPERLMRFRVVATGEERWASVRASPALDDQGNVHLVINFFRDVTDTRNAENALRRSEAWLATTLRSIGDAVIATDAEGRVTYVNPVAEALTGWPAAEALGMALQDVFQIVNEETRAAVENPVDRVLREKVIVGLANHTALIARDGTERSIADSGAPIHGDGGELSGVVLVFRDVTQERLALERERLLADVTRELTSSLEYTATLSKLARLVVPRLADWCVIELLDPCGVLRPLEVAHRDPAKVHWSREVSERYPADPNATTGPPNVARTGHSEMLADIPDALLVAGARDDEHLAILRAVGFTSYMCVALAARGRTLGTITFVAAESRQRYGPADLAFAEELARRAGLAIDNARLFREAQEASRLKDEFLATVSHELRTPLTAVLGWAQMLRAGTLSESKRAHALETIERNARAQAQLIEDLLDVHRIIAGKLRLDLVAVQPMEAVEMAMEAVRPVADVRGVTLQPVLDPSAGPILGDADRLQQVVWNLLSNAVKFTPRGGRVQVQLRRDGSAVELSVRDTGQGIDPGFLPFVFERFRQADASTTRAQGGLGLGLAIARHLVELHGGTIRAESDGVGRGASFVVRLPVAPLRPEQMPLLTKDGGLRGAFDGRVRLDGLRVLVVDDDTDARELVASVLTAAGALVTEAGSVRDAVDTIGRAPPDILVSDIGMPEEDGYALIRKVRALPAAVGGAVPAVALTAYARMEDRTRALQAGFATHVAKPVEPAELLVVIANLTGRITPQ